MRATQSGLDGFGDAIGCVCWICPQSTAAEVHASEEVTKYIVHAMMGSVDIGASIMFAPIFQDFHKPRKLKLKTPTIVAFRRFRMSGYKVCREKLLWKNVEYLNNKEARSAVILYAIHF